MKIILMRHGKPIISHIGRIAPTEMAHWIDNYDRSVVDSDGIPADSLKLANSASVIVSSTASRALTSVQALGHKASVVDRIFCEAQLPFTLWRFPRMPPNFWAAFFRVLWLLGYSRGADSIQVTKSRAKVAAQQLVALAEKGSVLLVGHGIMNRLIAKELMVLGCVSYSKHKSKYWSASVYVIQA